MMCDVVLMCGCGDLSCVPLGCERSCLVVGCLLRCIEHDGWCGACVLWCLFVLVWLCVMVFHCSVCSDG